MPTFDIYDESDRTNPTYHCKHGTFIGNPYGADHICGLCEDSTPDPTINELEAELTEYSRAFGRIYMQLRDLGLPTAEITTAFTETAQAKSDEINEVSRWAISDDDSDWMDRRHYARTHSDPGPIF